jgi:hypothetical protein
MMKKQGEIIAFSQVKPPDYSKKEITPYVETGTNTNDYIPFGSDNLFPQALAFFSRVSPNHRGVLISKEKFYQGDGIIANDTYSQAWIDQVNAEGETLNKVQKRLWTDDHRIGNVWIELISDSKGSFLFINHLDSTKCRLSKDGKMVILHPDWRNYVGRSDKLRKEIALYPEWSEDEETAGLMRSVYHKFSYEPEFTYYGIVGYISGKDAIQIDYKTNKWNLARLVNGFRPDNILFVPVKDKAEADKVMNEIDTHLGDGNQGKTFVVTKSRAMEGQKAEDVNITQLKTEDTGSWLDLHRQSLSDIVMAHGWFRSLCSIPDNTGFDTTRILNEYNIALPQIKEAQREYLELYTKLHYEVTGKEIDIDFKNSPPLPMENDRYKFIWEVRRDKGWDFDKSDPVQQEIVKPGAAQV